MNKYKVKVITAQRYTIVVGATDEETAVQGTLDLIEENPKGYITGVFDKFMFTPDIEVTEFKEVLV